MRCLILSLMLIMPGLQSISQDAAADQQKYINNTFEPHQFSNEVWKKATEELDYSDKREIEPKPAKPKENRDPVLNISQQTWRLIAFLILFSALILIVLKALGVNVFFHGKKNEPVKSFTAASFSDDIPESALEEALQDALTQKDYRMAIRIYYLMVIMELSQHKLIEWKKEKTNFEYLRELSGNPLHHAFHQVTLIFEKTWYGELKVSKQYFDELSYPFKNFLKSHPRK